MKEVIVLYDEGSGQIQDFSGSCVAHWVGFEYREPGQASDAAVSVDTLVRLKKAGFEAAEIALLKDSGLI